MLLLEVLCLSARCNPQGHQRLWSHCQRAHAWVLWFGLATCRPFAGSSYCIGPLHLLLRTAISRCSRPKHSVVLPPAPHYHTPHQVSAGKLRLILLKGPVGNCVVTGEFDPAKLDDTLRAFCKH